MNHICRLGKYELSISISSLTYVTQLYPMESGREYPVLVLFEQLNCIDLIIFVL